MLAFLAIMHLGTMLDYHDFARCQPEEERYFDICHFGHFGWWVTGGRRLAAGNWRIEPGWRQWVTGQASATIRQTESCV
jgi:hypothetical protein